MAASVPEVSEVTRLAIQIEALGKKIHSLLVQKTIAVRASDTYGRGHTVLDSPIIGAGPEPTEQVEFLGSAV